MRARRVGAAIGAFNVYSMEQAVGVIRGAEAARAPVILQVSPANLRAIGPEWFAPALSSLKDTANVPVAINLDHGQNLDDIVLALRHGFTAVMFDGSRLHHAENMRETRKVVELARGLGVVVEGELGAISGDEDVVESTDPGAAPQLTDPELAAEFASTTGVDLLAVAVGNAHGNYAGVPELNFGLIEAIAERTEPPLALHGASGLSAEDLRRSTAAGIAKANFNTDLRRGYVQGIDSWRAADGGRHDFTALRRSLIEVTADLVASRLEWLDAPRILEES